MVTYNKSYNFSSIDVEQCNNMRELIEYRHNNLITLSKLELRIKDKEIILNETHDLDVEYQVIKIRKAIISLNLLDAVITRRIDELKQNQI
jgi:hypothetical protein